jgi:hypothetical protein
MPRVSLGVPLRGFSDNRSPPYRFGRIGVLFVAAKQLADRHQDGEHEPLHGRGDLH